MTLSDSMPQALDERQRYEIVVRRIAEQEQRLERLLREALASAPHTVSLPWHVQELRRPSRQLPHPSV